MEASSIMAQTREAQDENQALKANLRVKFERSPRRVRAYFGDEVIVDTQDAMLLLEWRRPPQYYFPEEDVRTDLLVESDHTARRPSIGEATFWHVEVNGARAEDAAWSYPETKPDAPALEGYIALDWHKMDAWFEEDEQVFVHPKDPYVRVDTLVSSRHIRVEIDGQVVAESDRPVLLFETGLITRYYIPKLDVRMDLLEPSDTHTDCPYKGTASYHSVRVGDELHEDLVWYYPSPNAEVGKIQNLLSFYNEKVDIYLDGELQERPGSPFR
jgi:uncharacterized protein (DUF427 family)